MKNYFDKQYVCIQVFDKQNKLHKYLIINFYKYYIYNIYFFPTGKLWLKALVFIRICLRRLSPSLPEIYLFTEFTWTVSTAIRFDWKNKLPRCKNGSEVFQTERYPPSITLIENVWIWWKCTAWWGRKMIAQ